MYPHIFHTIIYIRIYSRKDFLDLIISQLTISGGASADVAT